MVGGLDGKSRLERALAGGQAGNMLGGSACTSTANSGSGRPRLNDCTAMNRAPSSPPPGWCCPISDPEDYEQVAATLEDIRRTHQPFSTRHRTKALQITARGDLAA